MKSAKGITTTSLIVYVIAMLIVIGIIGNITSFFYTNVLNMEDNNAKAEITKFNMYFLDEIKKANNSITGHTEKYISFSSGNTFSFQDNCIYLNSIRICEEIKNMKIQTQDKVDKTIITILITLGDKVEYTKTTNYVIKNM